MLLQAQNARGHRACPTIVPADECFDMATRNGAAALGFRDVTGELKPGLRADIAIFDLGDAARTPLRDPRSALCYASAGWTADTVLIDGEIVLRGGEFTRMDEDLIMDRVKNSCKRLGIGE